MISKHSINLAALFWFILGTPVLADTMVAQIPIIDAPAGTSGLGPGFRFGASPYKNIDGISSILNENQSDLVPLYLFQGKVLFSHGTSMGLHLMNTENWKLDAIGRYRFDRLEVDADPIFGGLEDREQTVDGGVSLSYGGDWGRLSASWVTDLLGKHNGSAYDLTYRYKMHRGRWLISPFVSYVFEDQTLTNYYFGVSSDEAGDEFGEYVADSSHFIRVGANTSFQLTERSLLFLNLGWEGMDQTVIDSPLTDKEQLASVFLGYAYFFDSLYSQSYGQSQSASNSRKNEWSWRVNLGYTAEETFHKVHRGYVETNELVDTYLGGLTLGKLLQAGDKIDFWGRFAFFRRFENGLQDNFWEYDAYIMAMGSGYSPWSQTELFRYGFGFGMSYATQIPIVEQLKQADRGRNTSHFLNYLEAQLDFPLQRLFGENASPNCYVGLTIVHRSGIFATSDIIGNVAGGSDVLSAHLECKR